MTILDGIDMSISLSQEILLDSAVLVLRDQALSVSPLSMMLAVHIL